MSKPYYSIKHIYQYFDNEEHLIPDDIKKNKENYMKVLPNNEYQYTIFNAKTASRFILENFGEEINHLFESCKLQAMKSDIFRLCCIYINGGIWIDCRTHLYPEFDDLINENHEIVFFKTHYNVLYNGFLICNTKKNKIVLGILNSVIDSIKKDINLYREYVDKKSDFIVKDISFISGPVIWTTYYKNNYEITKKQNLDIIVIQYDFDSNVRGKYFDRFWASYKNNPLNNYIHYFETKQKDAYYSLGDNLK